MKYINFSDLTFFFIFISQIYAYGFHCAEHVILKRGQHCSVITVGANKLIRLKDLKIINPYINCDREFTRTTVICVKVDTYFSYEDFNYDYYTIQKGDTCESIASYLETTIPVLERFNTDILNCDRIDKLVDVEIQYRADGDYKPLFENSTEIVI